MLTQPPTSEFHRFGIYQTNKIWMISRKYPHCEDHHLLIKDNDFTLSERSQVSQTFTCRNLILVPFDFTRYRNVNTKNCLYLNFCITIIDCVYSAEGYKMFLRVRIRGFEWHISRHAVYYAICAFTCTCIHVRVLNPYNTIHRFGDNCRIFLPWTTN